jgi:hypothetical protein
MTETLSSTTPKIPTLEEFKTEQASINADLELILVRQRKLADKFKGVALHFRLQDICTTLQQALHQQAVL